MSPAKLALQGELQQLHLFRGTAPQRLSSRHFVNKTISLVDARTQASLNSSASSGSGTRKLNSASQPFGAAECPRWSAESRLSAAVSTSEPSTLIVSEKGDPACNGLTCSLAISKRPRQTFNVRACLEQSIVKAFLYHCLAHLSSRMFTMREFACR